MKNIYLLLIVFMSVNVFAQLNRNSIFKLNNVTEAEMNAIVTPNEGSLVYNTTDDGIYKNNGTVWTRIDNSLQSIVLNRDSGEGGSGSTTGGAYIFEGDDGYHDFPVGGNINQVQEIDTNIFRIVGNGIVEVLEDGVYSISGGISTENDFPATANVKYILAVFLNGTNDANIIGFLNRGFVTAESNNEYWGTSGVLTYKLSANDEISLRYRIDAGEDLDGWFTNIGITKMK